MLLEVPTLQRLDVVLKDCEAVVVWVNGLTAAGKFEGSSLATLSIDITQCKVRKDNPQT